MTVGHRDLASFLGKKNFKGLYSRNPLARTPAYDKFDRTTAYMTSYPIRANHRVGQRLTDWRAVFAPRNIEQSRQPFARNPLTRSNRRIGDQLRQAILTDHATGESVQRLSFKYGIVVPRIEAVIKLDQVRQQQAEQQQKLASANKKVSVSPPESTPIWDDGRKRLVFKTLGSEKASLGPDKWFHIMITDQNTNPQNLLAKDVAKMARMMNSLFEEIPVDSEAKPLRRVDNLTEIPIPKQVSQQLFQSIAESEPFGPVDAAHTLGIEPAKTTLEKLTEVGDGETQEAQGTTRQKRGPVAFYAEQREGERHLWRFTDAKVGNVGYHYGASRDDRKHARRVRYLPDGRQMYPEPEHSS